MKAKKKEKKEIGEYIEYYRCGCTSGNVRYKLPSRVSGCHCINIHYNPKKSEAEYTMEYVDGKLVSVLS